MTNLANEQINAIHTMLTNGHRNLRMEAHSLCLWGLAGGFLFAISDFILTQEQIPDLKMRAFAWLLLLVLALGSVAITDWHLTKKIKATRDEVWSFIHRQIIKVWWLLMGIGILLTFAAFFFGGGYMVNPAWIILLGLGLFIHGLFSDEMLEWAGCALLILGIICLSLKLPFHQIKWIAASSFGVGLPLLSVILKQQKSAWAKPFYLIGWLIILVTIPLATLHFINDYAPNAPVVSLAEYQKHPNAAKMQIVAIPENTIVPVNIELTGDLFKNNPKLVLPLQLSKSIEIVMIDGKPTRKAHFVNNSWKNANEAGWLHIPWVRADMSANNTPEVNTSLIVNLLPN